MKTSFQPRLPLALTSIALLLALGSITFWSCSGDDGESVVPQEVFADSAVAMQAAESFHFTYEVEKPSDAEAPEGFDVVALEGDVAVEGRMRASVDLLQNGVPIEIEFVALEDTHYLRSPGASSWQAVPAAFSPVGNLNLGEGMIGILQQIEEPEYLGREEVDGNDAYHFRGSTPAQEVEAIVQAVDREEPFPTEVWIGVDNNLVRQIRLEGAATSGEPEETVRHLTLSDFGEEVTIEAPDGEGDSGNDSGSGSGSEAVSPETTG